MIPRPQGVGLTRLSPVHPPSEYAALGSRMPKALRGFRSATYPFVVERLGFFVTHACRAPSNGPTLDPQQPQSSLDRSGARNKNENQGRPPAAGGDDRAPDVSMPDPCGSDRPGFSP